MNPFQRKVALRVLGIHVGLILIIVVFSGLKGCFRLKPKPEIVTFIEFGQAAPPVVVEQVAQMTEPDPPAPQPEPEPEPVKMPDPVRIPEKPKKVIKPPTKIEKPKPKPEPVKPKWTPTKASDIDPNKSKKIEPKPVKPAVSATDIQKALKNVQSPSVTGSKPTPGPVGNPNAISAYDAHIYSVFYNAWERPSAPALRPAKVTLSISSGGRILSSRLSQSSGDANFDATVMSAVRRVSLLPQRPPSGYPLNNIIVQFEIIN